MSLFGSGMFGTSRGISAVTALLALKVGHVFLLAWRLFPATVLCLVTKETDH